MLLGAIIALITRQISVANALKSINLDVMSPLGNPQNFLIATQANLGNSFITFFRYLCIPTLINLFAAF
ncbi:anion transporter, partial [Francisella tularensis subsp. holarctica]|nr:anion transporter [Francisella tularensis subsp. holarctica]